MSTRAGAPGAGRRARATSGAVSGRSEAGSWLSATIAREGLWCCTRETMLLTRFPLLVSAVMVAGACSNTPPASPAQPATTIRLVSPPAASSGSETSEPARSADVSSPDPATTAASPDAQSGEHKCGCAPCEPIKSLDPCQTDADCAPSALCHATACVAVAKAPPRPAGPVMCTKNLVCNSTDVARCGCVDNLCALVAH